MDLKTTRFEIRPDIRRFENPDDMLGRCRKCGRPLVVLPDDRRFGFCFDCLDLLQISKRSENGEGRSFVLAHESHFPMR